MIEAAPEPAATEPQVLTAVAVAERFRDCRVECKLHDVFVYLQEAVAEEIRVPAIILVLPAREWPEAPARSSVDAVAASSRIVAAWILGGVGQEKMRVSGG